MPIRSEAKSLAPVLKLNGAFIRRTDLSGASLRGANLAGADAAHALFRGADFAGASLRGTSLLGADLSGAENLTIEQLSEAIIDRQTILPEYLDRSALHLS